MFNSPNRLIEEFKHDIAKQTEQAEKTYQTHQTANTDSVLGSAFSLLDISAQNNDYEEENFANEHRFQQKKIKKKGRRL